MSVRRALIKLWSTAKIFARPRAQGYHTGTVALPKHQIVAKAFGEGDVRAGVSRVQQGFDTARRIFASTLLSRVTTNVSAELRNRTTRQLLFGNSTPFFAFVGLSLATGSIITKEDELEGLCLEIRSSIERLHKATAEAESDLFTPNETIGIHNFTFGPYIGKGANAAIYCAKKKENNDVAGPDIQSHMPRGIFPFAIKMMFNYGVQSNAFLIMNKMANETLPARMVCTQIENEEEQPAIESIINEASVNLPPHPNIVSMHSALADYVPEGLPEALSEIPEALPVRLYSEGFGRNMTMFIVMKRYDTNLKAYLTERVADGSNVVKLPEVRESVLLFAQLLEGIAHINRHGVAHRDLKSDNLLLDLSSDADGRPEVPRLVLTDFGCSFHDSGGSLLLPFRTRHTDRGGNPALMAPEVINATPGPFAVIDYSKSDAWAAGAIAYELFTGRNPFINEPGSGGRALLNSRTYSEKDLPPLPSDVPDVVTRLLFALLARSPNKRPSAELAADILQLHLWAPSAWTKTVDGPLPSSSEILQWLLTMTTKVLTTDSYGGRRSQAEYQLIGSFLRRIKLERIRAALTFIQK
uniref:non-specific serine/threonine protein kinase n=3 Tax=Lygus hesperus TaxID=30085 RepID=A0A0A9X0X9_LYGHE